MVYGIKCFREIFETSMAYCSATLKYSNNTSWFMVSNALERSLKLGMHFHDQQSLCMVYRIYFLLLCSYSLLHFASTVSVPAVSVYYLCLSVETVWLHGGTDERVPLDDGPPRRGRGSALRVLPRPSSDGVDDNHPLRPSIQARTLSLHQTRPQGHSDRLRGAGLRQRWILWLFHPSAPGWYGTLKDCIAVSLWYYANEICYSIWYYANDFPF